VRNTILLLAAFFLRFGHADAQNLRTLAGTEFWVTFTENLYAPKDSVLHLIATPEFADTVVVFNPQLNYTESFAIRPGRQNNIYLKQKLFWYSPLSFGAQGTAVRVRSKYAIQLSAVNVVDGSLDMTSILPKTVLESARDYRVNNIAGTEGKNSQVAIVAIDTGNTDIEIVAGTDLSGLGGKGTVVSRRLKYGQVFVIQALGNQDLTGTTIKVKNSCKRLAVFAGVKCASFNSNSNCISCDAQYEQLWPNQYAQKDFFAVLPSGNTKHSIRILSLTNGTDVTANGIFRATLNAGETYTQEFNSSVVVECSKPALGMQVMHSNGCNGAFPANHGDPSLVALAGANQKTKKCLISAYRNTQLTQNAVCWFRQNLQPVLLVNKTAVNPTAYQQFVISGKTYWLVAVPITYNSTYVFESDSAFVAYQYGMGPQISYGMVAGVSFENSKADFIASPALLCNPATQVQFSSTGDSIKNIQWIFGDGNTASGGSASYAYNKPGVFKAMMVNNYGGGCPDTLSRIITILEGPKAMLPKDSFPCLGSVLRIQLPSVKGYSYSWDNGNTSILRTVPSDKKVWLTTTDSIGCSRTDSMAVEYRDCDVYDLKLANVFTPGTDGYNDLWKVIYSGYTEIDVRIYNRWGEYVYKYKLPEDEDWNGKVNNKFTDCPEGVYFYEIRATARRSDKNVNVYGSIQLIRE
jgi:gliding motility-associated-like protein